MARVTTSPTIGVISGKLGGVVFRKGKNGTQIMQTKPTSVTQPHSTRQAVQRAHFALITKAWNGLTVVEQTVWSTAAANGYGKRLDSSSGAMALIKPNTGRGGGKGLFMYCNIHVLENGGTLLTAPVAGAQIPADPGRYTAAFATGTLTITVTTPPTTPLIVTAWIKGTGKTPHKVRLMGTWTAGVLAVTSFQGAKGVPVNFSSIVGSQLYIQLETIDPGSGLASNASNTTVVTVA